MFKRVPGTKDILPGEVLAWQELEEKAKQIFSLYNYKEIRPPLIEEASLFNRSLGESAEIVQKQMFLISNKDDLYCLRPEATASVVRAYIENNLHKQTGFVKFYYKGAMFRLERPQKGRLRQFHHLGCEAIGSGDPHLDTEVISLADNLLKAFGLKDYRIKINSLGCLKDKKELSIKLKNSLEAKLEKLCADCKIRFRNNPLRILDCKIESCQEIVRGLQIHDDYLCPECKAHFSKVRAGLEALNINYEISPLLVRGLDYYTRTVFEIAHKDLGAQDALGAGGRYDNLVKELGGPDLGAIGFALGVERVLLVAKSVGEEVLQNRLVYIITLGEPAKSQGLKLLDKLRRAGITSDTDYENKSLKSALRLANDSGAPLVLIVGENELSKDVVTLKDMRLKEQKEVRYDDLLAQIELRLRE